MRGPFLHFFLKLSQACMMESGNVLNYSYNTTCFSLNSHPPCVIVHPYVLTYGDGHVHVTAWSVSIFCLIRFCGSSSYPIRRERRKKHEDGARVYCRTSLCLFLRQAELIRYSHATSSRERWKMADFSKLFPAQTHSSQWGTMRIAISISQTFPS